MPFKNINSMPKYTHRYSQKVRRQMMHVFNSTFKKVLKETGNTKTAERRSFMGMNSVLKKRFKGPKGMENNSQDDHFKMLIDTYLGNLRG